MGSAKDVVGHREIIEMHSRNRTRMQTQKISRSQ